jgi:hypothetical protein
MIAITPDTVLAAREITPVLRRELRANGPCAGKPYRIQTLATHEGTTDRVEDLTAAEAAQVARDEQLESWLPPGELEQLLGLANEVA